MQGKIEADLATIPPINMVIFFCGIALLLVLIAVIIHKLGIISIGPIKREQRGQSSMYNMNEENYKLDDTYRKQMREVTSKMKRYISNIFAELHVCTLSRLAISSVILFPMYESVANNHFTTELMPEQYGAYRERIIEAMQEEYKSLSTASMDIKCGSSTMPSWNTIESQIIGCIDIWLKKISREVLLCCEKKVKVYNKYIVDFEAAKDTYRAGIAKKCVEKNEGYITVLRTRTNRGAL